MAMIALNAAPMRKTLQFTGVSLVSIFILTTSALAAPQTETAPDPQIATDTAPADIGAPEMAAPDAIAVPGSPEMVDDQIADPVGQSKPDMMPKTMDDLPINAPVNTVTDMSKVDKGQVLGAAKDAGAVPVPSVSPVAPAGSVAPASSIAKGMTRYECHPQDNGKTECLCSTEAQCDALEASGECAPGTNWSSDTISGCTKAE